MNRNESARDLELDAGEGSTAGTGTDERSAASPPGNGTSPGPQEHGGHGRWMVIACCIPMLVIAVVLVATGVVGAGFILAALLCTAMMALMMRGMSGGDGSSHRH